MVRIRTSFPEHHLIRFEEPLTTFASDPARADGIDPHTVRAEFVREAVHEGVEPVLGHRVSAPAGGMGACRDRRDEDDRGARSRRADRRQRGLGHEIRGREVGLEDVVAVPFGR